jgi:hypothetical protein
MTDVKESTMAMSEDAAGALHGMYRDQLRAPDGRLIWDRGWRPNTIVKSCRQMLAGFMGGVPPTQGIQGLRVGQGNNTWDQSPPPLPPPATQTGLVDPNSFLLPRASLQIDFIDSGTVTGSPTSQLQIVATIGPHQPPWPDQNHPAANLREFGLVGKLNNNETLINYVIHPVIVKDPASTLTRTIWLTF